MAATLVLLAVVAPRSVWARRLAFVNLAQDAQRGQAAIDALRPVVARGAKLSPLAPGAAREALEAPLPPHDHDAQAADRGAELIEQARGALRVFDTERASTHLESAVELLVGLMPTRTIVETLYEAALLLGQVAAARGDEAGARTSFTLARRLRPDRPALDPARYRPRLVQLYAEAGKPAPATGRLRINSEPPGATVWLDGAAVAVAPVTVAEIPLGEHFLTVTLTGHAPHGERLVVRADVIEERAVLLSRLPVEARLRALRSEIPPAASPSALADAAHLVADAAAIDVVVYVDDRGGQLVATVWDPRRDTVGPWLPVEQRDAIIERVVPDVPPPSQAAVLVGPDGKPRPPTKPPQTPPSPSPSWYRTWWGVTLLAGGGVALAGVIYLLAADAPEQAPSSLVIKDPPVWLP